MRKVIFLILVFSLSVFSQDLLKTGTTAAQFLKIDLGPKAIGMGGGFVATSNDLSAMYWNPAGLAFMNSFGEAGFNHIEWFADISVENAAFALNLPGIGVVGAHLVSVNAIDAEPVRTPESPEGTGELFDASMFAIGLSYARQLTSQFSVGFNGKFIQENIWNSSASGFALDVGVLYKINILNEFRLGASISNFGTKMQMQGRDNKEVITVGGQNGNLITTEVELESWDLPLQFRVGVAADVFQQENNRITIGLDAIHPNDHTEYLNAGFEYAFREQVFIRMGTKSLFEKDAEQGLTLGAGVLTAIAGTTKIRIDYAWQDFGVLDQVQHMSLGVVF